MANQGKFKVFELTKVVSTDEAEANLRSLYVGTLTTVFGRDITFVPVEKLNLYFVAAGNLLLRGGLPEGRRKVCEHIVKYYCSRKMSGTLKDNLILSDADIQRMMADSSMREQGRESATNLE
jgi:hypothetical protein